MSRRDEIMVNFEKYRDEVNERVANGIEKNRKANAKIVVRDKNGAPVSDAKISAVQKDHDFRYGANIFMLDEMETPEKNERYKELFKDCFNMATLPFYWDGIEPEEGKLRYGKDAPKLYRRPSPDLCLEFCEKNGIEPREHALAYEHTFPNWLSEKSVPEVKALLEKRYKEISERYADRIKTIEVVNEMNWLKSQTKFYRADDYLPWCFEKAAEYFPNNILGINESSSYIFKDMGRRWTRYYLSIEKLLKSGVRIDAIGMQYHVFNTREDEKLNVDHRYNPMHVFDTLDVYSDFGLPLQLTEMTIPAYSNSAEDEALQAEIIEILYSIFFSHEKVTQLIYWNMVDGYAAFAPQGDMTCGENVFYGALVRFDMSVKPAYETIRHLFSERWRTNTELTTDASGSADLRGFMGNYELTVEKNGCKTKVSAHLDKTTGEIVITV